MMHLPLCQGAWIVDPHAQYGCSAKFKHLLVSIQVQAHTQAAQKNITATEAASKSCSLSMVPRSMAAWDLHGSGSLSNLIQILTNLPTRLPDRPARSAWLLATYVWPLSIPRVVCIWNASLVWLLVLLLFLPTLTTTGLPFGPIWTLSWNCS